MVIKQIICGCRELLHAVGISILLSADDLDVPCSDWASSSVLFVHTHIHVRAPVRLHRYISVACNTLLAYIYLFSNQTRFSFRLVATSDLISTSVWQSMIFFLFSVKQLLLTKIYYDKLTIKYIPGSCEFASVRNHVW